jgi:hypothetical protein
VFHQVVVEWLVTTDQVTCLFPRVVNPTSNIVYL